MAPTRYMLDTNTVSHIIKGTHPAVREHLSKVPMADICISVVTEAEMRFGVAKRPDLPKLQTAVREFLLRVDILPWDSAAAARYGDLRAALERTGKPLGNLDLMIAAHALSAGATLVTNDQAFGHAAALQVVDWTR